MNVSTFGIGKLIFNEVIMLEVRKSLFAGLVFDHYILLYHQLSGSFLALRKETFRKVLKVLGSSPSPLLEMLERVKSLRKFTTVGQILDTCIWNWAAKIYFIETR